MVRLFKRGIKVFQFLSGREKLENIDFFGVDNFAAGATTGRIIGRFLCDERRVQTIMQKTLEINPDTRRPMYCASKHAFP